MKNLQCTETARILLPWGGRILQYCPSHANQLVLVAQAMGSPLQAKLLPQEQSVVCESHDELTQEQKDMNILFNPAGA